MSKISDLLVKLENSSITEPAFIEAKVRIQTELIEVLSDADFESEMHRTVTRVYTNWRHLGGVKGTLAGYITAIGELKEALERFDGLETKS